MVAVSNYNMLKEGDLYNVLGLSSTLSGVLLTASQLNSLYDGSLSASDTTFSGATLSGSFITIEASFGESFDVNNVMYYQSGPTLSGISISYGVTDGTELSASLTLASGVVETGALGDTRYIRVTQSYSPLVEIEQYQLYIEGVENSDIGFGTSASGEITNLFVENSPIGYKSSTPLEIPVYNDYENTIDIKAAVAPGDQAVDRYLFLGTSEEGPFYGIDEHGFSVPGSKLIAHSYDSFMHYSKFSDIDEQWEVIEGQAQSRIYPDSTGLRITMSSVYGFSSDINGNNFWGVLGREGFTSDQSFTAKIKVKIEQWDFFFISTYADIVLGFTSGTPLRSSSYNTFWPFVDEGTGTRSVRSGACVGFNITGHGLGFSFPLAGQYRLSYSDGTLSQTQSIGNYWDVADDYLTFEKFSNIASGGISGNKDATAEAGFRLLILTWDHVNREVSGYVDGLRVGSHKFTTPPVEDCRLFFGAINNSPCSLDITFKEFEIDTENLYKQRVLNSRSGVTATALETLDTVSHGTEKLVDGIFAHTDAALGVAFSYSSNQAWFSGDPVQENDWIQLDLAETSDLLSISFKNPSASLTTTMSGITSTEWAAYLLKTVAIQVDGSSYSFYSLETGYSTDNTFLLKQPSGAPTVFSGSSSVKMSMVDFYSLPFATKESVVLDEIQLVEEYLSPITSFPTVASGSVPWSRGVFNNMKPSGNSGLWGIARHDLAEVAKLRDPTQLVVNTDFGFSDNSYSYSSDNTDMPSPSEARTILRARQESLSNAIGRWTWAGDAAKVWRRFKERYPMKAVLFYWGSSQGANVPQGYVDVFKVQSLIDGSDPVLEGSWRDVPVISTSYSGAGDYVTYRDYFIDNNDGEFYTDVAFAFPGDPSMPPTLFTLPSDVLLEKDFRYQTGEGWSMDRAGTIVNQIYLEFDVAVETEGLRLWIDSSLNSARTDSASLMNLLSVSMFAERVSGSYLSPVFDTGSRLNTERVAASLQARATASGTVYVRSHSQPPLYSEDAEVLHWQPWNYPLKDTLYDVVTGETLLLAPTTSIFSYKTWPSSGLVRGTKVYFNTYDAAHYPVSYDYDTNAWAILPKMGSLSTNARTDVGVVNAAALLSDGAMYVAVSVGAVNTSRLMKYDFEPDAYNITGWRHLGGNRPPETDDSSMVGYETSLYFFCSDGTTVKYDSVTGIWDTTLAGTPLHGNVERSGAWPVLKEGKVYLVGGSASSSAHMVPYIDIYNIGADTWEVGVGVFSYYPGKYAQAVLYGDFIYSFPRDTVYNATPAAFIIFDTRTNTFEWSDFYRLRASNFNVQHQTSFIAGAAWVYEDYLYCYSNSNGFAISDRGFRKTKLNRGAWSHGHLPSRIDPVWSMSSAPSAWQDVSNAGELMRQERYFQFKVQLDESLTGSVSPLLQKASLVTPISVDRVPASGTGSFYLKAGVSDEETYEGWYSGAFYTFAGYLYRGYTWTLYSATSRDGLAIDQSYQTHSLPAAADVFYNTSYTTPWVNKENPTTYKLWASNVRSLSGNTEPETVLSGTIEYATSSNGRDWSAFTSVVPFSSYGTYDAHAAIDPCVIKIGTSDYRMWYTGVQTDTEDKRVLYATSSDGVTWSSFSLSHDFNTPALPLQADATGAYAPCVVYSAESLVFTMWYSGINTAGKPSIIRCVSTDGITWATHNVVIPFAYEGVFDENKAHYPVVVLDVDTYEMWYIGEDSGLESRVLYATSSDGVTWAAPVAVLAAGLHGQDSGAVGRLMMINNRNLEIPNSYLTGARLKIYNG